MNWPKETFKQHSGRGNKYTADFKRVNKEIPDKILSRNFCQKCGAWHGQLGLEPTLDLYINHLLQITAELKRVLKPTGVMFWNHGDCYGGSISAPNEPKLGKRAKDRIMPRKAIAIPKCLCLQNFRLITQMIDQQGWILRNTIIWHKPNHMPSSVKDRFTNAYEPVFMLTKNKKYWFDLDAVRKPYRESSLQRISQDLDQQEGGKKQKAYREQHIIPLTKGGTNKYENLAVACQNCNTSKRNKFLEEWFRNEKEDF